MSICPNCHVFYATGRAHACTRNINPLELLAGVVFGSILGAAFGFLGVATAACYGVAGGGPCVVPGVLYGVPLGVFAGVMVGAKLAVES